MGIDVVDVTLANKYTDETVIGGGAIKGKNCVIEKVDEFEDRTEVTFGWTLDDGTKKTRTITVTNGADGYTPQKDVDYFDGEKGNKGDKGDDGVGIELVTKTGSTGIVDNYEILFTDGTITTYTVVNGANITKLSELENDEEFIKATTLSLTNYFLKTETYSKSQIDELLRNIGAGLSVKIVATLPVTEISGTTIYLINTSGSNYNQYMYIDGAWANLGSTEVDMSSYYNKSQIDLKLEDYVTANRLTNKLDDYVQKDKLSKVGSTNSYNDLDDLPTIPDVEGIKPYTNELQDSENTAPTSKALYDAVQDINDSLDNKLEESDLDGYAKIDDAATSTENVWSAKKVSDSLVDIDADNVNITKEDDTKKSLQAMYEDGELGGGGGSDDYSTEEKVIGKWIDGKPIYRKVVDGLNVTITNAWANVGNIANINIVTKLVVWGKYVSNSSPIIISPCAIVENNTVKANSLSLGVVANKAIIEYTKTTD